MRHLILILLAAAPLTPGPAAFERLKRLEGAWHSKDARYLTLRVVAGGAAVVETHTSGPGKQLDSVIVYRLENGELVAMYDGGAHATLKLASATERELRFVDKGSGSSLLVSSASTDALEEQVSLHGANEATVVFLREYVDTLK